jgi:hypothetical protein
MRLQTYAESMSTADDVAIGLTSLCDDLEA